MAIVRFSTADGNSILNHLVGLIDSNVNPGYINIYTGPMPATPNTAITTQLLLGTLVFSKPCGTVSNKSLTFNEILEDVSADDTGTVVWGRVFNGAGLPIIDVDATIVGGGGALQFNTVSIVQNGAIDLTSFIINIG